MDQVRIYVPHAATVNGIQSLPEQFETVDTVKQLQLPRVSYNV